MEWQCFPSSCDLEKSPRTWCCSEPSLKNADLRQIYQERWIIPISNHLGCLDIKYIRTPNNSGGSPVEMCSIGKTHTKALLLHPWVPALIVSPLCRDYYHKGLELYSKFYRSCFSILLRPVQPPVHRVSGPFLMPVAPIRIATLFAIYVMIRKFLIVASDTINKKRPQNHQSHRWVAKVFFFPS